jgi:hypothetical protein
VRNFINTNFLSICKMTDPTFKITYDIHGLENDIEGLLTELQELLYNKTNRTDIIKQHKLRLSKKYHYLYTKIPKLFELAIEYYIDLKSIREFRDIFSHYMYQVRQLQKKPESYTNTSKHIGEFIGEKYLPKE